MKISFYKLIRILQLNSTSDTFIFLPVGFEHKPFLSRDKDFLMSYASSAGCEPSDE